MKTFQAITKFLLSALFFLNLAIASATPTPSCVEILNDHRGDIVSSIEKNGHIFIKACAASNPSVYISVVDLKRKELELNHYGLKVHRL